MIAIEIHGRPFVSANNVTIYTVVMTRRRGGDEVRGGLIDVTGRFRVYIIHGKRRGATENHTAQRILQLGYKSASRRTGSATHEYGRTRVEFQAKT